MELIDSYLKAVKRYLPRAQRNDIVAELKVDLRSQIDDKQAELGRLLTDVEQMAIFRQNGDPMAVALRYRSTGRSLTVGWELIGPELFPAYLILLGCNLLITIVVVAIFLAQGPRALHGSGILHAAGDAGRGRDIGFHSAEFSARFCRPQTRWIVDVAPGGPCAPVALASVVFGYRIRCLRCSDSLVAVDPTLSTPASGLGRAGFAIHATVAEILRSHSVAPVCGCGSKSGECRAA